MLKRLSVLFLVILFAVSLFGCGKKEEAVDKQEVSQEVKETTDQKPEDKKVEQKGRYDERVKLTVTTFDAPDQLDLTNDKVYSVLDEKFNFDLEVIPLSWANWVERDRVWIASGDMPDAMFTNFNFTDYMNYYEQGLVKVLPDDLEEKYPNLAKVINSSEVTSFLREKANGQLATIPHIAYLNETGDTGVDTFTILYRKDWAEEMGIELGDFITLSEFEAFANKLKETDLSALGAKGEVACMTGNPEFIDFTILPVFNPNYKYFYNNGGEYSFGLLEDGTKEGIAYLRKCFNEGIIDKDYYTNVDASEVFNSGRAAMVPMNSIDIMRYIHTFQNFNPGIDATEVLAMTQLVSDDGTYNGYIPNNFWSVSMFNPNISDEKLDRILSIYDFVSTQEGQELVYLGIEGEDFNKNNDGTYEVTRPLDDQGNPTAIMKMYPSTSYFASQPLLRDNWTLYNEPTIPKELRQQIVNLIDMKTANATEKSLTRAWVDFDVLYMNTPYKSKFNNAVIGDEIITEVVVSDDSIDDAFEKAINKYKVEIENVLKEIKDTVK